MIYRIIDFHDFFRFPSAGKLRAKSDKTMVACAVAGHSKYLQKGWNERGEAGQLFAAQVLPDLQRRPVRQRSLSADLIFWLLLYQDKSNSLCGY